MKTLEVLLNNQIILSFDRNHSISLEQQNTLKKMEQRMNDGIQLGGELVESPTVLQKTQYAANSMVFSLLKEDFNQAMAMCMYLGTRLPDLNQVICTGNKKRGIKIEFIVDNAAKQKQNTAALQSEQDLEQDLEKAAENRPSGEKTIKFFDPKDFMKQ